MLEGISAVGRGAVSGIIGGDQPRFHFFLTGNGSFPFPWCDVWTVGLRQRSVAGDWVC